MRKKKVRRRKSKIKSTKLRVNTVEITCLKTRTVFYCADETKLLTIRDTEPCDLTQLKQYTVSQYRTSSLRETYS